MNEGMFRKKCDKCGVNDVWVYAIDRQGNLPKAYCGKVCTANVKYDKKFDRRFQ